MTIPLPWNYPSSIAWSVGFHREKTIPFVGICRNLQVKRFYFTRKYPHSWLENGPFFQESCLKNDVFQLAILVDPGVEIPQFAVLCVFFFPAAKSMKKMDDQIHRSRREKTCEVSSMKKNSLVLGGSPHWVSGVSKETTRRKPYLRAKTKLFYHLYTSHEIFQWYC